MSNPFELAPDATAGASIDVDDAVKRFFPEGSRIDSAVGHGASLWTRSARIDIETSDGTPKSYFIKVAPGPNGRSMLEGEYHSAMDMRAVLPGFSPIPIGWGVFDSDQDLAFFLQAFHDMDTEIPDMDQLTRTLAEFHIKSEERFEELTRDRRPDGMKFGYHEEYFTQNMKRMLEHDEKEGGERPQELEELLQPLFDKVIPRLLRPMEMNGGEVKPSLIHGDLWYGNTSTDHENNVPIVYDACCFWGHNEYEIRTMRAKTRYRFGKAQQRAYLQHYPAAYPVQDFEARNALYHL
ncbi:uncharacterized protein ALTATR162_LOCUS11927 [Alternaria atra]|uniref:protein-ribulosamine 3-kinase n=1 Tax=Alternaria atra TaxID=119953 RepID=A0A8J2IBX4_9PLEO|nr:uncharacterized protein ALTATR162_LOCUS11927 [Alternaria atra]CAG5188315.1 unnamed protein product [Alternaria atra]